MAEELQEDDDNVLFVAPASWLSRMFGGGEALVFPDLTLRVGEEWSMGAHRCVLASSIPYFQRALSEGWAEFESGEVNFSQDQVCPESLRALVGTSYGLRVLLSDQNVCHIHATANFLGLEKGMGEKCVRFLTNNLKPETAVRAWLYAQREFPGSANLLDQCVKFVIAQFHLISDTPDFFGLKWDKFVSLSSLDNLRKSQSESAILDGYLKWLNYDWAERYSKVSGIIQLIRWDEIDFDAVDNFESVDRIRNATRRDADGERMADLLISRKLFSASKRRRLGSTVGELQNWETGLKIDLEFSKSPGIAFLMRVNFEDSEPPGYDFRYTLTRYDHLGGEYIRAEHAVSWLLCHHGAQVALAAFFIPSLFCGLLRNSSSRQPKWKFALFDSQGSKNQFIVGIPNGDLMGKQVRAVLTQNKELCVLTMAHQEKAKKLFVLSFKRAFEVPGLLGLELEIPYVFSLDIEQVLFKNGLTGCAIGAVKAHFVLVGGVTTVRDGNSVVYNRKFWILGLDNFSWIEGPTFPYDAANPSVCAAEDYLFVSGGSRDGTTLAAAFCHKLGTAFWTRLPLMRGPREGHSLVVCGDRLVALGGSSQGCSVNFSEELDLNCLSEGWKEVDAFKNLKAEFVSSY